MLKLLGTVLIISSFSALGMSMRQRLKTRIYALITMISALDFLCGEIRFKLTSLPEIISRLAQEGGTAAQRLFSELEQEMEKQDGLSLSYKWLKTFREVGPETGLAREEIDILCSLSSSIGQYDIEQQMKNLEYARKRLESCLVMAKSELQMRGNVYRACTIAAGIMLVLILI